MWKIKLDDTLWLADGSAITTKEEDAWMLPDIPSAIAQLEKARRFMQYSKAIVISEFPNN